MSRSFVLHSLRRAAAVFALLLLIAGAAPAQSAKEGELCGGVSGTICGKGLWCEPKAALCSISLTGVCVATGVGCPKIYAPECGCDGKTYGNSCERRNAKVTLFLPGVCPGDTKSKR